MMPIGSSISTSTSGGCPGLMFHSKLNSTLNADFFPLNTIDHKTGKTTELQFWTTEINGHAFYLKW